MTSCIKLGAAPQVNSQGLLTCYGHKKPAIACLITAHTQYIANPLRDHVDENHPAVINPPLNSIMYAGQIIPLKSLKTETARRMNMTLVLCQQGATEYIKTIPLTQGKRLVFICQYVKIAATGAITERWYPQKQFDDEAKDYGGRLPFIRFNSNTFRTEFSQLCPECVGRNFSCSEDIIDFIKSYTNVAI